jgi:DNA-binding NarL/FixJ family response regulator
VQSSSASSAIPRSRARGDQLDIARGAWFRAEYRACLAALDAFTPYNRAQRIEATLLRARALVRLNDPAAAIALLREAEPWIDGVDAVATTQMLLGGAVARVESEGAGLAILDEAADFARNQFAHPSIAAEIDYTRALVHWTRGDLDRAEALADTVAASGADIIAARAGQLASLIDAANGLHVRSYHRALDALSTLSMCGHRDDHLTANLLHQVSVYEAELRGVITIPQWRLVRNEILFASPNVAAGSRTGTALYETYAALLDDDEERAFMQARLADTLAPSSGYRSRTLAARANVSRLYAETRNARQFIDHAAELAESYDWDSADDDESIGLVAVAEELRWYDSARANALVDRYERISGKKDALLVRSHDVRYRALQDLLIGAVRTMSDRRDLNAVERLRHACSAFKSIGYLSRAAWALIEMDEAYRRIGIAAPNDYFLTGARQIIRTHFPRSFLARRIGTCETSHPEGPGVNLTIAQREVLRGLCAGKTVEAIAEKRNCSPLTVRNHIDAAMKRFGVRSRADLVRELARRGWFGPSNLTPPESGRAVAAGPWFQRGSRGIGN